MTRDSSPPSFGQPPRGHRDWYLFEAVRAIPRILMMVDRNPVSPTFGCFDREYWHYRTVDFPCGMSQEFCLALAQAWATPHPENPFFRNARLHEIVAASLHFARRSAYKDGSCDDYFPGEKAMGALVFSLYAMSESYQLLRLEDPALLAFLARRGTWLLRNNESGRLANHQALAALGLANLHALTGEPRFLAGARAYRDLTLSWQHAEGWFQEYEGADPGYHSCTIDFLAKLRRKTSDETLTEPLLRAVDFAAHFAHPDGSYAGEYGSRNTYHFYPHGFELLAAESSAALRICELYLRSGLPRRTRYFNDDNRMCAHYVYDWFQAWADYAALPGRSGELSPVARKTVFFPGAKLLVRIDSGATVVVAAAKGGMVKVVGADGPVFSDTGPMVQFADGTVLVSHLISADTTVAWSDEAQTLTIRGHLCRRRAPVMTPLKQIAFRLLSITLGAINPNWLRRLVQALIITGKSTTRSTFERVVWLLPDRLELTDRITVRGQRSSVRQVVAAPDATSIYVANSNTYQDTNLLPVRRLDSVRDSILARGCGEESITIPLPS